MKHKIFTGQPRHKWVLVSGLLAALGFTISMDPANHMLARHQQINVTNLATTAAPADAEIEVATVTVKKTSLKVTGANNQAFLVDIAEIDGKAQAKFSRLQSSTVAQGADCGLCGETRVLTNNLSNLQNLKTELQGIINTQASKPVETKPAAVPGKATEADLKEWAAKCEDKEDEQKLSCHTDQLVKLSKHLANETAQASLVFEYYREYIYSDLRAGFRVSPYSSLHQELLGEAQDTYTRLFEELRGKNGKTVRDNIIRLHSSSYSNQARYGQQLIVDGLSQSRPDLMNAGYVWIHRLRGMAQQSQAFHQSAIYDIDGLSRLDQSQLFDVTRQQMSGVSRMLQELLMAKDIRTHQIPMLGGDRFPITGSEGGPVTDIVGPSITQLQEMMRARQAANQNRNSGVAIPSQSGPSALPFSAPGDIRNMRSGQRY